MRAFILWMCMLDIQRWHIYFRVFILCVVRCSMFFQFIPFYWCVYSVRGVRCARSPIFIIIIYTQCTHFHLCFSLFFAHTHTNPLQMQSLAVRLEQHFECTHIVCKHTYTRPMIISLLSFFFFYSSLARAASNKMEDIFIGAFLIWILMVFFRLFFFRSILIRYAFRGIESLFAFAFDTMLGDHRPRSNDEK